MADPLAERRRERERLCSVGRAYVTRLARRVSLRAAAIVGSVARGDFNVWSDIDVVVVSDDLPWRIPDRGLILAQDALPGVQPIGFTSEEFLREYRRSNPLAREAVEAGVTLHGEDFFAGLRAGRASAT